MTIYSQLHFFLSIHPCKSKMVKCDKRVSYHIKAFIKSTTTEFLSLLKRLQNSGVVYMIFMYNIYI